MRWLNWAALLFQEAPLRTVLQPESLREEGGFLTLVALTDARVPQAQVVSGLNTILTGRGESPTTTADSVSVARWGLTISVAPVAGTQVRVTVRVSTAAPPP
ncbi:MAG: hypothetical protein NZ951_06540 [Dehalococcoidia bacterium]|nr:hypothetical protein [Dehalococcoidia bacterium]MDW8120625.1 hypothetical protein [Chloroflexota bacterium]